MSPIFWTILPLPICSLISSYIDPIQKHKRSFPRCRWLLNWELHLMRASSSYHRWDVLIKLFLNWHIAKFHKHLYHQKNVHRLFLECQPCDVYQIPTHQNLFLQPLPMTQKLKDSSLFLFGQKIFFICWLTPKLSVCFFSSSGTHQYHHLDGCQAIGINSSFIFPFWVLLFL